LDSLPMRAKPYSAATQGVGLGPRLPFKASLPKTVRGRDIDSPERDAVFQTILQKVFQNLVQEADLADTLELIVRGVSDVAQFKSCGIFLPEPGDHPIRLRLEASCGIPPEYVKELNAMGVFSLDPQVAVSSPTVHAFDTREPEVLANVLDSPWRDWALKVGYRSLVCVPLTVLGEVIGVLNGYGARIHDYSAVELSRIRVLADQAAIAVRIGSLLREQQSTITRLQELNVQLHDQQRALERSEEIHRTLTAAVISGASFDSVTQILAELVKGPVEVRDSQGRLTSSSEGPPHNQLMTHWQLAMPLLSRANEGRAFILPPKPGASKKERGTGVLVAPIWIGDELLGCVAAEEGGLEERTLELRAVEHGATVLALILVQERVARNTEERLKSDFLNDLLSGRIDSAQLSERARSYDLDLNLEYRAVVVEVDVVRNQLVGTGDIKDKTSVPSDHTVTLVRDVMSRALPGSLLTSSGNRVLAVCPAEQGVRGIQRIKVAISEAQKSAARLARGSTLSAGVGSVAGQVADYAKSYKSANQCLDVIHKLGRPGQCLVIDELGISALLLNSQNPSELVAFAEQVLGPVLSYDRRSHSMLYRTLETLIDNEWDTTRSARALFVHPNTVKYRVRRLQEVTGLSVSSSGTQLDITLARTIARLLGQS
jgi:sugar diacid utilization regulator